MTKNKNIISVGFISLGCAKNLVDSEVMATTLLSAGFALAPSPEQADVVLVNTCAFINDAREESVSGILEACAMKKNGKCRAVIVAGCMPQRYKKELLDAVPEIDALIGLDELQKIPEIVNTALSGTGPVYDVSEKASAVIDPAGARVIFTGAPYAYVKVAEGCNHRCAFCAIPFIRGKYRSRKIENIMRESEGLLENGIRELNLISQDIMAYGTDLGQGVNLPNLLRALAGIGGKFRIRLLYGGSSYLTDELLHLMGELKPVCRYLDIPFQHADSLVLKKMGRKGSRREHLKLVRHIREILPGATLRTTCLVGFPGETEKSFDELADFVAEAEFDHLGVFTYSREENTRAYSMKGAVPKKRKESRRDRLLVIQSGIIDRKATQRKGTITEVLVDGTASGRKNDMIGRSDREAPEVDGNIIIKNAAGKCCPGDFVKVRLVKQRECDMTGEVVGGSGGKKLRS